MTNESLLEEKIWIENNNISVINSEIISTPRIGVDYAEDEFLVEMYAIVTLFWSTIGGSWLNKTNWLSGASTPWTTTNKTWLKVVA